jgi:hypothetical protein
MEQTIAIPSRRPVNLTYVLEHSRYFVLDYRKYWSVGIIGNWKDRIWGYETLKKIHAQARILL